MSENHLPSISYLTKITICLRHIQKKDIAILFLFFTQIYYIALYVQYFANMQFVTISL